MNIGDIYTGKRYLYAKPKARNRLVVEAVAVDTYNNMVLVVNLNTNKTLRVNAAALLPISQTRAPSSVRVTA